MFGIFKKKSSEPTTKPTKKKKYRNYLFNLEGTVAEPWPTSDELWADPKVRAILEKHNESVTKKSTSK